MSVAHVMPIASRRAPAPLHDPELERSVVAAALASPKLVLPAIADDHLVDATSRATLAAIRRVHAAGQRPNVETVRAALHDAGDAGRAESLAERIETARPIDVSGLAAATRRLRHLDALRARSEAAVRLASAAQRGDDTEELTDALRAAERDLAQFSEVATSEWADPRPIAGELPDFPVDALPSPISEWARSISHETQTPVDMPAMMALAAISAACARRVEVVVRDGWREPVNLYCVVAMAPGERKSGVVKRAYAPIADHDLDQAVAAKKPMADHASDMRIAQARLAEAEKKSTKAGADESELRLARARVLELEESAPRAEQLVASDITSEAIVERLAANGGRLAIFDAEGCGPVGIMLGRYTDGEVSVDQYLRGHAGDDIRVDRRGRAPIVVRSPALTIGLATQPEVIRALGERRQLRGLGMLARFLFALPRSRVGTRDSDPAPVPSLIERAYRDRVLALLALRADEEGSPRTLRFSGESQAMMIELLEWVEPQLAVGAELHAIGDWAAKFAGAVARIAGLLHCVAHPRAPHEREVEPDTLRRAIEIGQYCIAHARAALGLAASGDDTAAARTVLSALIAGEHREVKRRDLLRALRSVDASTVDRGIARLEELGWLRVEQRLAGGAIARTVPTVVVHPRAAKLASTPRGER